MASVWQSNGIKKCKKGHHFSGAGGANIALIISSHYVGVPGVIIGCYYVIMGTALPDLCLVREATGRGGSEENFLCLNNQPTNLDHKSHKDTHKTYPYSTLCNDSPYP